MGGGRRCSQRITDFPVGGVRCTESPCGTSRASAFQAHGARSAPRSTPRKTSMPGHAPKAGSTTALQVQSTPRAVQKPIAWQPREHDIITAVASLCSDELKPYGRILRKRLVEHAGALGLGAVDVDIKLLQATCVASAHLLVEAEDGGEFSAVLRGYAQNFIDFYSPIDVYPEALWTSAAAYFQTLDGAAAELPGGRYACAQALVERRLPFLAGYSLGQMSHIVQLALSHKRILGYLNGTIVPYRTSQSMVKECCASWQRPCSSLGSFSSSSLELPLATWESARTYMREILNTACADGKEYVPISNVKRLFRSRFHRNLSETALGYSKLSGLLSDIRFSDICTVQLQDQGYVVVPRVKPSGGHVISLANELSSSCGVVTSIYGTPDNLGSCADETLSLAHSAPCVSGEVAALPPTSQWASLVACPALIANTQNAPTFSFSTPSAFFDDFHRSSAAQRAPASSSSTAFFEGSHTRSIVQHPPALFPSTMCFQAVASLQHTPVLSPSTAFFEGASMQRIDDCGAQREPPSNGAATAFNWVNISATAVTDTPLQLRTPTPPIAQPDLGVLPPSVISGTGCVSNIVKNTFIHALLPPSPPLPGAMRRSESLPRDMGSLKDSWEAACQTGTRSVSAMKWQESKAAMAATVSKA